VLRHENVERARRNAKAGEQSRADHAAHLRQQLVVRGGQHGAVEAQVGVDGRRAFVLGGLHVGIGLRDRLDLARGRALGGQRGGRGLDHAPQLEHLLEELPARHRGIAPAQNVEVEQVPVRGLQYASAGARARVHQPFGRKRLQRFAHHGAARAQVATQLALGKRLAGLQRAAHDAAAELLDHLAEQIALARLPRLERPKVFVNHRLFVFIISYDKLNPGTL
jgi:hypothetical protein